MANNNHLGRVTAINTDSTGGGIAGSTSVRNVGGNGLIVRPASVNSTTASGQAATAGDNTIFSSASGAIYVYAYSLSHVATIRNTCRFVSGSTTSEMWRTWLQSQSSAASSGVSVMADHEVLAVSPPNYLFRTSTGDALVMNTVSSGVNYGIAAWRE